MVSEGLILNHREPLTMSSFWEKALEPGQPSEFFCTMPIHRFMSYIMYKYIQV